MASCSISCLNRFIYSSLHSYFTMKRHCARLEIQPFYAGLLLSQHQPLTFELTLMKQNSRKRRFPFPLNRNIVTLVVGRLDNAIHWINRYTGITVDKRDHAIHWIVIYLAWIVRNHHRVDSIIQGSNSVLLVTQYKIKSYIMQWIKSKNYHR